jgi:hypothetical protein
MAKFIKIKELKRVNKALIKELEKFALPGRNAQKSIEELYGLWEGRDISTERFEKINQSAFKNYHG